jgi:hypothetical protein
MRSPEKAGKQDEANSIYGEWQAVREEEEYDVNRVETIHYRHPAARYKVPEPEEDDPKYWRHYN